VNEGFYMDGAGETHVGSSRVYLLGVLCAGPQWDVEGTIAVRDVPTTVQSVAVTKVMVNLGHVIKAREVSVLGQHVVSVLASRGAI